MSNSTIELHIGKYTNKDLAEWFGISANTFNKTKENKLAELEAFAKFHMDGKRVVIDKVLKPVYSKQDSNAYQMIKNKVDDFWSPTGLDSCSHVKDQIVEYYGDKLPVAESTAYAYTRRGRNELYGVPYVGGGSLGNCSYIWCKKDDTGELKYLTPEEEKLKGDLIKKYFGDATEKQILVSGMVEAGEISKDQAWDVLTELTNMKGNNFYSFLMELQDKLGCKIIRGTKIERFESAF